jgi:hypothetical protein
MEEVEGNSNAVPTNEGLKIKAHFARRTFLRAYAAVVTTAK